MSTAFHLSQLQRSMLHSKSKNTMMQQCQRTQNGRMSGKACNCFVPTVITKSQAATFNLRLQKRGNIWKHMLSKNGEQKGMNRIFHIPCKSNFTMWMQNGYKRIISISILHFGGFEFVDVRLLIHLILNWSQYPRGINRTKRVLIKIC